MAAKNTHKTAQAAKVGKPFAAGNPGKPKGAVNKTTLALKEAILLAAEKVGHDGNGKDGLTGYLRSLAVSEPASFATLLGKVLPMQMTGEAGGPIEAKITVEYVRPNPAA